MYQEMATIPISKGPGLTLRLGRAPPGALVNRTEQLTGFHHHSWGPSHVPVKLTTAPVACDNSH